MAKEKTYEVLDRLEQHVDKQAFYALYGITRRREWLFRKQSQLVELWQLCDTNDEKNLVLDLLGRFAYLTGANVEDACHQISKFVVDTWKCEPRKTLLTAVASDAEPDGSQSVLQFLKNCLTDSDGWKTERFYSQLPEALVHCKPGTNLILIEDFVGTGDKLTAAVAQVQEYFRANEIGNVNIYAVLVSAMRQAQPVLNELGIKYYCASWHNKGISDHYAGADLIAALKSIRAISKKLSLRHNGQFLNPLGYKKSESIVYIEPVSVPNNVFPIFWWPTLRSGKRRQTLFARQR